MPGLAELLQQHPNPETHVRARVAQATAGMERGTRPEPVDLIGACLGNSYQTVRSLLADGSLPELLDPLSRERASASGQSEIDAYIEVLRLPRGRTVQQTVLPTSATPQYGLFPHQARAVRQARQLLATGPRKALLHMPTGAGKTRTTMNLVCEMLREDPAPVLWLASTQELCEQAVLEFSTAWSYLGNQTVEIHPLWGGRTWEVDEVAAGFTVATPQALHARRKRDGGFEDLIRFGEHLQLLVFDEAHQIVAPTYASISENMRLAGAGTPLLGLSATPGRTFEVSDKDAELAQFFGEAKVLLDTGPEGDANPVRYLINNGYLAKPDFRILSPDGLAPSGSCLQDVVFDPDDDAELQMDPVDYVRLIADTTHELADEGHHRILVFAASVDLAEDISAALTATGLLAECVHGATDPEMRTAAIERYRADGPSPRALVNFGVLTTGFDAPRTSAAIIARPTKSLVLYSQMVGRAIRGPAAGGNPRGTATIVTVVDPGVPAFGSIAAAFTHWEGNWG